MQQNIIQEIESFIGYGRSNPNNTFISESYMQQNIIQEIEKFYRLRTIKP